MKQVVRRGRKFVEYHDPDTQDEFTFTQEISGADVSYQDEAGNWHPADENWQTDGLDGFILKNDKLNHKVRLNGKGGRRWYPRRNVSTEYLTFGIPQFWDGKRWKNFGFNGYSVEGKTITLQTRQGVTILVHNRWNGIKIDWVLANASAPTRMRYPVALTGITYSDGAIYGADGTRLGQLTPTTATDSTFDEDGMPTQLPCSGSYSGGYVEFQADVTGAAYPVTIDPDFTGANADAYIRGGDADYATARLTASYYNNSETTLSIGQFLLTGTYYIYRGFVVFDTSSIDDGATITQVNLKATCQSNASGGVDFDVQIVKYDWSQWESGQSNATYRETAYDGCLSADADDNVLDNTSYLAGNTQYTSGNLSTSWVSKTGKTYYGLRSSNDVAATAPAGQDYVKIYSNNSSTESYRPVLTVTYTAGSTGALRRTNMNAQMSNLTGGMHG